MTKDRIHFVSGSDRNLESKEKKDNCKYSFGNLEDLGNYLECSFGQKQIP